MRGFLGYALRASLGMTPFFLLAEYSISWVNFLG